MENVVLVDGVSDRVALEALATRTRTTLPRIVELGGATNVLKAVNALPNTRILGLCDVAERRLFERAGITGDDLFLCDRDLEDELIRALSVEATEAVIDSQGNGRQLRTLKAQPAHRDDEPSALLRRFMGTTSGRKAKYGVALVNALPLDRMPDPLRELIAAVSE